MHLEVMSPSFSRKSGYIVSAPPRVASTGMPQRFEKSATALFVSGRL
jgi:hypothetical protein